MRKLSVAVEHFPIAVQGVANLIGRVKAGDFNTSRAREVFAERGFHRAVDWLTATLEAITSCECRTGCPSCIQSPKCGNGNQPLDKDRARRTLHHLLLRSPGATGRQ